VRHKGLVPKKLEEKRPENYVYDEYKEAIQALTTVAGVNDSQHYNMFVDNNGLDQLSGLAEIGLGARVHLGSVGLEGGRSRQLL